jgi:hypothetical protein
VPRISLRDEAVLIALVVTVVYLAGSVSDALLVGALNDDGVYTVLGRALAEGRGYHSLHLVGQPVQVKYPPGFPVILSLLWRLGGSLTAVQHIVGRLHAAVVGTLAALLWWLGRARFGAPRALLVLFVLTPLLLDAAIQYYTIPLAEPWFMLGWVGVLVLWDRASAAQPGRIRSLLLLAAGLLAGVTVLVRNQAIVLLPALLLGLASRRCRFRDHLMTVAPMLLPIGVWHFYHAALIARGPLARLPDETAYGTWLTGQGSGLANTLLGSVRDNVISYGTQMGPYLTATHPLGELIVLMAVVVMALGAVLLLRREPVLGISAIGALGIVLIWPYAQDRLLLSVLPFTGLALVGALAPWSRRWPTPAGRAVAYGAGLCLTLVLLRQLDIRREAITAVEGARSPVLFTPSYTLLKSSRYIAHASYWIRANTTPSDRLMIDNPSGMYLYSGRSTIPANPAESHMQHSVFERPGQYLASHLLDDSLTYVIVGVHLAGISRDIETVQTRCPGVLTWGGTSPQDSRSILRVRRDAACLRPLADSARVQ